MKLRYDYPKGIFYWAWRIWEVNPGHYLKVAWDGQMLLCLVQGDALNQSPAIRGDAERIVLAEPCQEIQLTYPTPTAAETAFGQPESVLLEVLL